MSQKEDAAFQEYLEGLKSSLPQDMHPHIDALAAQDAFKSFNAKGWIGQKEIGRRFNELSEAEKKLAAEKAARDAWFEAEKPKNERLLRERETLSSQVSQMQKALLEAGLIDQNLLGDNPMNVAASGNKQEIEELKQQLKEAKEAIGGMNNALPHFLKDTLRVSHWIQKGNYDLDPGVVLDYSMQNRVTPEVAFNTLTADERQKRAEADLSAKLKAAEEKGAREAMSKLTTPDFVRPPAPSIPQFERVMRKAEEGDPLAKRDKAVGAWMELLQKDQLQG